MRTDVLCEAYERLRHTGPEWGENTLTNHGPMAVEVLVRRGRAAQVHRWLDAYIKRLEPVSSGGDAITSETWRDALGDPRRLADWTEYFSRRLAEQPWREVLATWWARLLPGVAAGTTHGLIRVGHTVRALLAVPGGSAVTDSDACPPAVVELAHGLAFWAARYQPIPGAADPSGTLNPADALDAVPRLAEQEGTVAARLARLPDLPGFAGGTAALRTPDDPHTVPTALADLVAAGTLQYLRCGNASPIILVHVATAPNAVLHTLPALPQALWRPSLAAAWWASAAITAGYAPAQPERATAAALEPSDVLDRAIEHGDEHVIKFTDTAVDVFDRTGDPRALAAAVRARQLI